MIRFKELSEKYTPNNSSTNFENNTCRKRLLNKFIGEGNWEYVYEGRKAVGINLINEETSNDDVQEDSNKIKKAIKVTTNKGDRYLIIDEDEELIDVDPVIVEINTSTEYENKAKEVSKEYEEYLDLEDEFSEPASKYYYKLALYIKDTLNLDGDPCDICVEDYIDILREEFEKVKPVYEATRYSTKLNYKLKEAIYDIHELLYSRVEKENSKKYLNEKGVIYQIDNYDIDKYIEFLNKNGIKAKMNIGFLGICFITYGDDMKTSNNGIYDYIKFDIDGKECFKVVRSAYLSENDYTCNKAFVDEYNKFINVLD